MIYTTISLPFLVDLGMVYQWVHHTIPKVGDSHSISTCYSSLWLFLCILRVPRHLGRDSRDGFCPEMWNILTLWPLIIVMLLFIKIKQPVFFFYRVCYTTLYILGITGIDEMKIPTKNNHDFDDGPVILGILYIQDYPTL